MFKTSVWTQFLDWFARESDAKFLENLAIHLAGHDGGVHLAAVEEGEAVEGAAVIMLGSNYCIAILAKNCSAARTAQVFL